MPDTVEIAVRLHCFRRQEATQWVAGCPSLDVYSQAETADGSEAALQEAIELWVESCLERGTLEQALREVGWHLSAGMPVPPREAAETTELDSAQEVLGEPFFLEVTIPAFETTTLLHRAAS